MASPFSFHCMICIEEFAPSDRWPVVLPCGHTYVCNQCAERLSRCMECRESLLANDPTGAPVLAYRPTPSASDWRTRRGGPQSRGPPNQPLVPSTPKKRLPLPKNVVLMSLMEATEAVAQPQMEPVPSALSPEVRNTVLSDGGAENEVELDEDEQEEEKIRVSTSLAIGSCGTYVITTNSGVVIYPSKPAEGGKRATNENEDVDTMVRFFYLDQRMTVASSPDDESKELPPVVLSKGDRVQIVSMDDGWAKLARGYGYIRVRGGQVVKVSGPVDRACKLEALLRSITVRRKELRREQRRIDSQFVQLMNDLQFSLQNDEDLSVIGADTFAKVDSAAVDDKKEDVDEEGVEQTKDDESTRSEQNERSARAAFLIANNDSLGDSITDVEKPHRMIRADSPPSILPQSGMGCFSPSLFADFGDSKCPPESPLTRGCTGSGISMAGIIGALSFVDDNNSISDANQASARVMMPHRLDPHPSPRAMSAGARAWRERNNREPSRGIDFRTGMSGHMALLSTHRSSNSRGEEPARSNTSMLGKMSAHMGLTFASASRTKPRRPSIRQTATVSSSPGCDDSFDDSQTI